MGVGGGGGGGQQCLESNPPREGDVPSVLLIYACLHVQWSLLPKRGI